MKLVHKISINAIGIALVFISTCVLNVNIGTSLTNLGDAFIFLFACFFGPISGLVCGSIGSFLADLVVFPVTAFYTLIIKGLEGLIVGLLTNLVYKKASKLKGLFIALSSIIGSLFMILGYFIAEAFLYGSLQTAVVSIYSNLLQASLSVILFVFLYNILKDRNIIKNVIRR